MKVKNFLSIENLSQAEIESLILDAAAGKNQGRTKLLEGITLALLFEKPSLRTRVSFEMAMRQSGGDALYLSPAEVGLGGRESVADVARVLGRYVNGIAARTFSHRTVETLAQYAGVPVINALSDYEHPCQALADLLTVFEHKGGLQGVTLAYIGDGNNVAVSLSLAAAMMGMNFHIASPQGYALSENILTRARKYAEENGAVIHCFTQPEEAVSGADAVYTDVWTSMGQEAETAERRKAFTGYCVDSRLMSLAKTDAIFMHDLPAHRGEEVTDDVIDGPQSVVFDQAENRLHAQKALVVRLLSKDGR